MSTARWRFVNRGSPSESIVVADFESAKTLARILQNVATQGQWFLQEEMAIETLEALASAEKPLRGSVPVIPPRPKLSAAGPGVPEWSPAPSRSAPELSRAEVQEPAQEGAQQAQPEERFPPSIFSTERRNGKRRYDRYKVEFRIILVSGGKTFRSFSNDVSVGGMLLKQKIPVTMLDRVCTVFIGSRSGPENIELKCRIIADSENPRRVVFVDCDVPSLKRLESWMTAAREQITASAQVA